MNYPVWDVPVLGSGLVVAIIAIIHVLISHIAVGGGAFIAVAEWWALRQEDGERIRAFLKRFVQYFLLYTTVLGATTGVGIWFAIGLANPEGTSLLIHQYVFAWATEWVTFIGELTVLYYYYYGWETNSRRMQILLAVLYFVIAWFSLFIINGILTFMLTPGGWTLENRDIVAGFFNPTYTPALIARTLVMLVLAGLFAILVATRVDDDLKERIIAFAAKFVVPAAILVPLVTIWYWYMLPESVHTMWRNGLVGVAGGRLEAMTRYSWLAVLTGALVTAGTLVIAARPRATTTGAALALLVIAQCGVLGGEFFREMARKPYVIHGALYSNGLWKSVSKAPATLDAPYFEATRWEPPDVAPGSPAHGEWIYRLQCASCHTLDGYRALDTRTRQWTPTFADRFLQNLPQQGVMPPFHGNAADRAALAAWLISRHGTPVSAADVEAAVKREAAGAQTATPPPATAAALEVKQ